MKIAKLFRCLFPCIRKTKEKERLEQLQKESENLELAKSMNDLGFEPKGNGPDLLVTDCNESKTQEFENKGHL